MRLGKHGTILRNSLVDYPPRVRFTIAHELGHWFLHPNHSQDYLFEENALARYKRSQVEDEANTFAGALLMPRKWFGKGLVNIPPLVQPIIELADKFDVSIMAATKRYMDLTLMPSVAISSDGEHVRWTWPSNGAKVFIRAGMEIDPDSTAYDCQDTPEQATRIGPVKSTGDMWFPNPFSDDEVLIEEQSCRLNQDIVLTLVRII